MTNETWETWRSADPEFIAIHSSMKKIVQIWNVKIMSALFQHKWTKFRFWHKPIDPGIENSSFNYLLFSGKCIKLTLITWSTSCSLPSSFNLCHFHAPPLSLSLSLEVSSLFLYLLSYLLFVSPSVYWMPCSSCELSTSRSASSGQRNKSSFLLSLCFVFVFGICPIGLLFFPFVFFVFVFFWLLGPFYSGFLMQAGFIISFCFAFDSGHIWKTSAWLFLVSISHACFLYSFKCFVWPFLLNWWFSFPLQFIPLLFLLFFPFVYNCSL